MEDLTKKLNDFIGKENMEEANEDTKTVYQKDGLIERVEVKNVSVKVKTDKGIKQLLND